MTQHDSTHRRFMSTRIKDGQHKPTKSVVLSPVQDIGKSEIRPVKPPRNHGHCRARTGNTGRLSPGGVTRERHRRSIESPEMPPCSGVPDNARNYPGDSSLRLLSTTGSANGRGMYLPRKCSISGRTSSSLCVRVSEATGSHLQATGDSLLDGKSTITNTR